MKKLQQLNVDFFVGKIRDSNSSEWQVRKAALAIIQLITPSQTGELNLFIECIQAGQSAETAARHTLGIHIPVITPVLMDVHDDLSKAFNSMVSSDTWYDEDKENKL